MIRVVVADDHPILREGVKSLLEGQRDIEIAGEADDGREAIRIVDETNPDVTIIDLSMPRLNGVEAILRIREAHPEVRVLVLTAHEEKTLVDRAARAGASGWVSKGALSDDLVQAVRAVAAGGEHWGTYAPPDDRSRDGTGEVEEALAVLTPREREVLQLVAEGRTNNAIALELQISVKTVEKHRGAVMEKLGLDDVAGLVRFAIQHHVVFTEDRLT